MAVKLADRAVAIRNHNTGWKGFLAATYLTKQDQLQSDTRRLMALPRKVLNTPTD